MKKEKTLPPKLFLRLFRWFCRPELADDIEGDLIEEYHQRCERNGKSVSKIKFAKDVVLLFRPGIIRPIKLPNFNPDIMFQSYFKTGWRTLTKNKGYALINIGGLAVGMAVAILIGLWIYDEVSYNKYHSNYDRIARVLVNGNNSSGWYQQWTTPPPLAPAIRADFGSDFEHVIVSTQPYGGLVLSYGDRSVGKSGYFAEPGMAEMLSLRMKKGSYASLVNKESIILSASTAKAIFGTDDPINKIISINSLVVATVTGVFEDLPDNSAFSDMEFLSTWELLISFSGKIDLNNWEHNGFITWVQLKKNAEASELSHKIANTYLKRVNKGMAESKPQLYLHPMSQWRLHSEFDNGIPSGGRIRVVWLYGIIGFAVLLLACINFMNLATARSEKRAREVGIRKSIGSARIQIIQQFFSESILVAAFAFAAALVFAQLAIPFFNLVTEKEMTMPWDVPGFWIAGIIFVILTGVLAGSYPALYLSSFTPVKVIKGTFKAGRGGSLPRKVLVVLQFVVSITLIVSVLIVFRQVQYGKDRALGYDQNGLVFVFTPTRVIHNHIEALRNEILKTGAIIDAAESLHVPTTIAFHIGGYDWDGPGSGEFGFATAYISARFGTTMGWKFTDGRDFSADIITDSTAMILNESAVKIMNLKDPVGKTVRHTLFGKTTAYTVVGVIKDMLQESPYESTQKTIYMFDNGYWNKNGGTLINFRLNPNLKSQDALAIIENIYKKYDPTSSFEPRFVDQDYGRKFAEEERTGKVALILAGLAILISCLGIFGLASYVAEQRTREIGIRKVMGASVISLWQMLSREFILLVLIACGLSIPLSWYFMHGWLQTFEYHTGLSWTIFVTASLAAMFITLATVSYQAIAAAKANPVRSLRSE